MSDSKVTLTKPVPSISGDPSVSQQQSRTVHVANLDRSITENDLRAYFEQCGAVSHVYIVAGEPGQPMRYGFVEFADVASTTKAFAMSGCVLGQYGIRVSQAKGIITGSANKTAVLPGLPAPNVAAQEAMNAAYAVALQAENLKYQQYMARKQQKASDSDSDDSRKRRRRRRRRSRSNSSDRGKRRKRRSRSRSGSRSRRKAAKAIEQ